MSSIKQDERGFSPVESLLLVVIVAIIGGTGWYIYHSKQETNKTLDAATSTSTGASPRFANDSKSNQTAKAANSGDTSNAALQSDLSSATSTSNQDNKDIAGTNDSLNDKSTLTSVPQ
jgi:uncharacterized protein HemX